MALMTWAVSEICEQEKSVKLSLYLKKKSQQFERENVPDFPQGQIVHSNKDKYQFNVTTEILVRNSFLNIQITSSG